MDEDESEQEDSSVHSSSVRSDSSGRVKKNKRGRPAKKKKKSAHSLPVLWTMFEDSAVLNQISVTEIIICFNCSRSFSHIQICCLQAQVRRRATAMRRIIRTTARCASRAERSSCATLVLELTTSSAWSPSWTKPPRASGAARTA